MGDYEIHAKLTGFHNPDEQLRGPGEAVHEFGAFLRHLVSHGHTLHSAEVTHWPGTDSEHVQVLHGGESEPAGEPAGKVEASEPGRLDPAAAEHAAEPAEAPAPSAPAEG